MPNALQTDPLVLASRARDGDQQALAELYRRHSAALLRHARRMMGDDSAAQDIVQEAFARAIASIGRTREELHFKAWIFRITTNLCLRALTRAARCRPSEAPDQNVATSDDEADPERVRLRREAGVCVQEALGRLPDRYRQILLLREIEQLSYEELADVLELSKANVKVTLHRARARFAVAFISGQLLAPASAEDARGGDAGSDAELAAVGDDAECAQLEALMVQRERRALERHLEQCPRCREKEAQRCARRFAVLPPLPPLALGLSGLASGGAGASSAGATGATTTT
ncbi:MAG: RNA polymerase sigma factor, partial [Myxococcales bacterium]|nr:RNA polymerase sigma factor [Myxococcales bacterium]